MSTKIVQTQSVQVVIPESSEKPIFTARRYRQADYRAVFDLIGVEGRTADEIMKRIEFHDLPMPPSMDALRVALRREGYATRDGIGSGAPDYRNVGAEYVRRDVRPQVTYPSVD